MTRRSSLPLLLVLLAAPARAGGDVEVVLQNNTERTLLLEQRAQGACLPREAWDGAPRRVGPGERVRILRFAAAGRLPRFEDFVFRTEVRFDPPWVEPDLVLSQAFPASDRVPRWRLNDGPWRRDRRQEVARLSSPRRELAGGLRLTSRFATVGRVRQLELALAEAAEPAAPPADRDQLRLLSWNLFLRPTTLFSDGQAARVRALPPRLRGYDAVLVQEAFDDGQREALLEAARPDYPFATRVVGQDRGLAQDGGVLILSRWPIVREAQRSFRDASGSDAMAEKGVVYACLDKGGRRYHVFATHTNAGAEQDPDKVRVRALQLAEMAGFVAAQRIPADEAVLFGGDMNIDCRQGGAEPEGELRTMLTALRAGLPALEGPLRFSYDGDLNPLTEERERLLLDCLLWSRDHLQPSAAAMRVRLLRAELPWERGERSCWELSDHFAVEARFTFPAAPAARAGLVEALNPRAEAASSSPR